ncbi:MAG: quaternary ammonium compound efflux SMR transporter SugE [Spirochaetia bacterium]|nr:quaternary ammonium compound efflux SMR transporter SugE [Spirochaetia bacterium]
MNWFILVVAGLFETAWAVSLKYTEGFTKLMPSVLTVTLMAVSFFLLSSSLKTIPVGTAYAVWTGIGALGVALIGIFFLHEPAGIGRLVSLLLVVTGIAGLKVFA